MEEPQHLRILVVGGTGFVGYHAILELLRRGHGVMAIGLEPRPDGLLPDAVDYRQADLNQLSDSEVSELLAGQDGLVFAAGADDRVMPKAPAYSFFHQHNVASVERLFGLAREAGVTRGVVCGSYFAHFARRHPEWKLGERHPYIRSRLAQAEAAIGAGGDSMRVCVLELPYIFGRMPGRLPLWCPLVKYLRSRWPLFYTRGGSSMVTIQGVAEAIAGALENEGAVGPCPVGGENRLWPEFLEPMARATGRDKRVWPLPTALIYVVMALVWLVHRVKGIESGLHPTAFVALQTRCLFLDPELARRTLGCTPGDLDEALAETVEACSAAPR